MRLSVSVGLKRRLISSTNFGFRAKGKAFLAAQKVLAVARALCAGGSRSRVAWTQSNARVGSGREHGPGSARAQKVTGTAAFFWTRPWARCGSMQCIYWICQAN